MHMYFHVHVYTYNIYAQHGEYITDVKAYHSSSGVKYFVDDAELVVRGAMERGSVEVDHIT